MSKEVVKMFMDGFIKPKKNEMYFLTVYKHPKDFPDQYVLLTHYLNTTNGKERRDERCIVAATYEEIEDLLKTGGYTKTTRYVNDNPAILETWI